MEYEIKDGEPEFAGVKSRGKRSAIPALVKALDKLRVGQWIELEKRHRQYAYFVIAVFKEISEKRYSVNTSERSGVFILRRVQ